MLPFIAISVDLCDIFLFHFLSTSVGSQTRPSTDVGVKKKSNTRLHKVKLHLMMPSEAS